MRADRLVAILLLLQARGQVTARDVAEEMEISERTARRDLEALAMAGIPVYSQQGKGGGWRLAGRGRTDLSGLTGPEARALLRVASPASEASPEVKAALRKLIHALPQPFRDQAETASEALVFDPESWGRRQGSRATGDRRSPPLLDEVQQAVVLGRVLQLDYVDRTRVASTRIAHPLGLAAKGQIWYLVAGTAVGIRTFRVDRIIGLAQTGETVVRPEGFHLEEQWGDITAEFDRQLMPVTARVALNAEVIGWFRFEFGTRVGIGPAGEDGRVQAEVRGRSVSTLAADLVRFGGAVEVLEPAEVRAALIRLAEAVLTSHRSDPSGLPAGPAEAAPLGLSIG